MIDIMLTKTQDHQEVQVPDLPKDQVVQVPDLLQDQVFLDQML